MRSDHDTRFLPRHGISSRFHIPSCEPRISIFNGLHKLASTCSFRLFGAPVTWLLKKEGVVVSIPHAFFGIAIWLGDTHPKSHGPRRGARDQLPNGYTASSQWVWKQFACIFADRSTANALRKYLPICPHFTWWVKCKWIVNELSDSLQAYLTGPL